MRVSRGVASTLLEDPDWGSNPYDMSIICQGAVFPCHQVILAAASSYLKNLLLTISPLGDPVDDQVAISLPDHDSQEVDGILAFLYGRLETQLLPSQVFADLKLGSFSEEKCGDYLTNRKITRPRGSHRPTTVPVLTSAEPPAHSHAQKEEEKYIDYELEDNIERNNCNDGEEKAGEDGSACQAVSSKSRNSKRRGKKADSLLKNAATRWSDCQFCGKPVRAPFIHVFRKHPDRLQEYYDSRKKRKPVMWPKKCEHCDKYLNDSYKLMKHVRSHERRGDVPGVPPTLPAPSRRTSTRSATAANVSNNVDGAAGAESKTLVCDVCASVFHSERTLSHHLTAHKQDKVCGMDGCEELFRSARALKEHKLVVHRVYMPINQPRSRRAKDTTASDSAHTSSQSPEPNTNSEDATATSSFSGNDTVRLCNLCGKAFQTERGFRSHLKAHNANENFRCEICAKTMRTPQTFQDHMLLHSEPRLECPDCGKFFHNKKYLLRHFITAHTSDAQKQYKCSYCPKGFMDEKKMLDHENWHKGIKPHKCCWCDKAYQNFANLSAHQRAVHLDLYRLRHKEKARIQVKYKRVQQAEQQPGATAREYVLSSP